jgi:hypothetical protein
MIVDIVDKLIDRCLQLIQRREDQNKQLLEEFAVPAYDDFEELHKDYIESFKSYRKSFHEDNHPLTLDNPIFEQIREDSLFSAELRSKVIALQDFQKDPIVGGFIQAIAIYVLGQERYADTLANGYRTNVNAPRLRVIHGLKEIFQLSISDDKKKEKAIATVDELINERQGDYLYVRMEFSKLKAKLQNLNLSSAD